VQLPLALSGDQVIALVGVTSGALVGLAGLVFAYVNGEREREHSKQLARSGRLHEQRREAYITLAELLEKVRTYINRTETALDVPAPNPPGDDEWVSTEAVAAVSAPSDVVAAFQSAKQAGIDFIARVLSYRGIRHQGGRPQMEEGARQEMEQARERAIAAIDEVERIMREELAEL
jgi:hypothetical protein